MPRTPTSLNDEWGESVKTYAARAKPSQTTSTPPLPAVGSGQYTLRTGDGRRLVGTHASSSISLKTTQFHRLITTPPALRRARCRVRMSLSLHPHYIPPPPMMLLAASPPHRRRSVLGGGGGGGGGGGDCFAERITPAPINLEPAAGWRRRGPYSSPRVHGIPRLYWPTR